MLVRPLQLRKLIPIEVKPSGIVKLVRLVQPLKALAPIEVTLLGIVMLARPEQLLNA